MTLLLWIPITLLTVAIRLGMWVTKLTSRLALATAKEIQAEVKKNTKVDTGSNEVTEKVKDTVSTGKKVVKGTAKAVTGTTEFAVRTTKITMRVATTTVKIGIRAVKLGVKALKALIMLLKLLIQLITWLAGIIASMGLVALVIVIVLVIVVVAGGVFSTLWDDKITVKVDNSTTVVNTANKTAGSSSATITGDLSDLDTKKINYEVKYNGSSHKKGIKTNLTRADVKKMINILIKKENTMARGGSTVSKYLYYTQTNSFGRGSTCSTVAFDDMNKDGALSSSKNMKCMAGLRLSDKRVYGVDCSSFIGWFYATLFSAYDKDNENLDDLANWFAGFRSTDYQSSEYCTKISKDEVQAGDIKFTPANGKHGANHVVLCIDKDKCIGASSSKTGIKVGNLAYYDDAGAYYRPNFKFADE